MRRLVLIPLLLATGCNVSLVNWGQNPVIGCADDNQCPTGSFCNAGSCQFISRLCTSDGMCDPGDRCSIRGVCISSQDDYCEMCRSNLDCTSGICAQLGDGGPICATSCDACPNGASCQQLVDGSGNDAGMACLPANGVCP